MIIRRSLPEDAPSIARVQVDTWRATYRGIVSEDYLNAMNYEKSAARWREGMTANPQNFIFVAEDPGIVGYALGGPERDADPQFKAELWAIYVLATHQRRGLGRLLFDAVVREFVNRGYASMLLWVLKDNPSRAFYESLGGTLLREKPITIGSSVLTEVGYGWPDLKAPA